jgi:hypothetical protein
MATYKGIQGFTIQNLSADPSNPIEGQVWYNSTSNVWKVEEATTVGAWATGGALNTARFEFSRCRNSNSSFSFWWYDPRLVHQQQKNIMEQLGQILILNTARNNLGGVGTQTAGLAFGGATTPPNTGATEEYDGSTWTSNPTGLNTARYQLAGAGTQTAALAFGGYILHLLLQVINSNGRI